MKRILHTLAVLSMVLAFNTAMAQGKAKVVFEESEHDFGSFLESAGVQKTTFKFKNEGDAPLVLSNVRASCGCT
ncbi:MAG TPA: DUF1573 domain-containing protein, partial [Draconibacterium sp.]|nr:DUF1573 domain-containing protein [Draconibacterium sp.]